MFHGYIHVLVLTLDDVRRNKLRPSWVGTKSLGRRNNQISHVTERHNTCPVVKGSKKWLNQQFLSLCKGRRELTESKKVQQKSGSLELSSISKQPVAYTSPIWIARHCLYGVAVCAQACILAFNIVFFYGSNVIDGGDRKPRIIPGDSQSCQHKSTFVLQSLNTSLCSCVCMDINSQKWSDVASQRSSNMYNKLTTLLDSL